MIFKQGFLKKTLVSILIVSWIFSGWPPIGGFPPRPNTAQAAVAYVGGQVGNSIGDNGTTTVNFSLTGGSDSTPQAGDLVIISFSNGDANDKSLTIKNASAVAYTYAGGSDLYQNGTSFGSNFVVGYRFMPPTPESSALLAGGDNSGGRAWSVHVFRGVDPGTPLDVAAVTAGNTGTHLADPGQITPSTSGAWIYVSGAGATSTGANFAAGYLTAFLTANGVDNQDGTVGAGYVTWSSGTYNPAAFTGGGTDSTSDSWNAVTLALKPVVIAVPNAPTLYPDDGGSNQIAFNNTRQNDATPIVRASATHTASFNRFQVEFNTASDFSGTAYTETFSSTYSSGTTYNLQTTGTLNLPTTDGATYFVRARASANGGTNYGNWSSGTWSYTYKSSGNPNWFQTTDAQFGTDTLSGTSTSGSGSVQYTGSPGTIRSSEIDYDWTTGQVKWGSVAFSTTETNGDIKLKVYYTISTACDTVVPDSALPGNSSGFDVSASPISLSGLTPVASTYNKICLLATLTNSGGTPYLNDWSVSWSATAGLSTAIEVRAQNYTTSISSITFPQVAPSTVSDHPYNDVNGSGSPQTYGGAGNAKPVVTLYNGGSGALTIWYNITTFTNGIVASENILINNKGAACSDASCITGTVVFDADTSTGVSISAGAGNEKDLYLKATMSALFGRSGDSTLTILGETP